MIQRVYALGRTLPNYKVPMNGTPRRIPDALRNCI